MPEQTPASRLPTHHLSSMRGRDPHEHHRVATPLELLFDLTFVIAFGLAASQLAHLLAEGHYAAGLMGFGFAMFAVCWAWVNFSWFASAFDTDDWVYRMTTMVQMVGVLILALGLPQMFESIDKGEHVNNGIMVLGYVVMRVAMTFQWLRAARQNPERRAACLTYAIAISIAQIGWVVLIFIDMPLLPTFLCVVTLTLVEMLGPVVAERRNGGTPWHAHHIAERYGLLAIITLGEGVVGTVASISAITGEQGWNLDAILVCIAGTGLTFGMWWLYFLLPSGQILHRFRNRSFLWGYGHMLIFAAIAATGAGLHVAAYYIEHKAHISATATVLTVAVPVGAYILLIFAHYVYLLQRMEAFYLWLQAGSAILLALPVLAAAAGVGMTACLAVLMLAPLVPVIGYEVKGHHYGNRALARALES
ncbi:low temperature requirement protein A [Rhizobium herbae]|uniref:Low temperature requirement protein LtrA n=1 Tax=Rhizobium herbae TaxID=508661 RepID=A0ABS4EN91_9HYPH|nr:low temperature requirement protein A [Rhizobium herbae]MBP1859383.1 low temperature requirement protein LtrA [Rhizobium herbae]